jgi:uncharacterized protein YdcH (DUF465 family)
MENKIDCRKTKVMLNGESVQLDFVYGNEKLVELYGHCCVDGIWNLGKLSNEERVDFLFMLSRSAGNYASMMSEDEVIAQIPNGRSMHNEFFDGYNSMHARIKRKEKNGESVPQEKLQELYSKSVLDCKRYVNKVGKLYDKSLEGGNSI